MALSQKQLERKLGKMTTVLDGLRKDSNDHNLPPHVRFNLARVTDSLSTVCSEIRHILLANDRQARS